MSFAWMSNPQYLAQVGHFLGAENDREQRGGRDEPVAGGWVPILITLGIGILAASFKEFVFDA